MKGDRFDEWMTIIGAVALALWIVWQILPANRSAGYGDSSSQVETMR